MRATLILAVVACSLGGVEAGWTKNINYRSPSENHPGMGISIHKVNKRNT
jgi:alkaline phosphatase D